MNVFISYTTQYLSQVSKVAEYLKSRAVKPFLDWQTISPGDLWPEKLEKALTGCRMALVFLGKETGPWQKREIYYLLDRSVRVGTAIIPILIEHAEPPIGLLGLHHWLDWRSGIGSDQLRELDSTLERSDVQRPPGYNVADKLNVNPYRGERPYREIDGNLGPFHKTFAARDSDIMHLTNLVRDPYAGVIQLAGEPNVGKASLIYAGVLPALQRPGSAMGNNRFSVAHVQIGLDPLHDLAGALAKVDMSLSSNHAADRTELAIQIEEGLRDKRRYLETYLAQLVGNDDGRLGIERALIVFHGAERLWDCERSLTDKFKGIIRSAAESRHVNFVFSTVRDLPFDSDRTAYVGKIPESAYAEVIREPAIVAGIHVEEEVIERVVNESKSIRSVQRILSRIWQNRRNNVLDADALRRALV